MFSIQDSKFNKILYIHVFSNMMNISIQIIIERPLYFQDIILTTCTNMGMNGLKRFIQLNGKLIGALLYRVTRNSWGKDYVKKHNSTKILLLVITLQFISIIASVRSDTLQVSYDLLSTYCDPSCVLTDFGIVSLFELDVGGSVREK